MKRIIYLAMLLICSVAKAQTSALRDLRSFSSTSGGPLVQFQVRLSAVALSQNLPPLRFTLRLNIPL
ncbi:MAG TPA: hypothetical protein VFZ78_08045, partial [Flavisolibacter sp.]